MRKRYDGPDPPWNIDGSAGIRVYMVFFNEHGEDTMIEAKDEAKQRLAGVVGGKEEFRFYVVAHDWIEAMTRLNKKLGLGPYKAPEFD
jgi:hypothetical protein